MKKLFANLISHNISLFGGKFILGQSYQPELSIKYCNRNNWKMSYYSLNLGILTISFEFSHDGVHKLSLCSPLTNHYRTDKFVIDYQDKHITHTWNGKDQSGNHKYCYNQLFDWSEYNKFGTRTPYASRIERNS